MASGTEEHLRDITAVDESGVHHFYVVGHGGVAKHRGPGGWENLYSGSSADLEGVWGRSSTDVFAVGAAGTILHYDGASWSVMNSGVGVGLNDVHGNAQFAVAVGDQGVILVDTGAGWARLESGTQADLYGVWVSSDGVTYAVGAGGVVLRR